MKKKTSLKIENKGPYIKRGSGMNVVVAKDSIISNKSTTAHTNYQQQEEFPCPDSDTEEHLCAAAPRTLFNINNETGRRGAKPESNQIRDSEATMVRQKKEKCVELFRNNGEIREMIVSRETNPQGHDLTAVIEMLYSNKHFLNCKFSTFHFLSFQCLEIYTPRKHRTIKLKR